MLKPKCKLCGARHDGLCPDLRREEPPSVLSREVFRELGRRRWRGKSEEEKSAHARMMVEARAKKEQHG